MKDDPQRILGTRYLGPDSLHPLTLPSPDGDARDATVKVWDPSLSEMADSLPPGEFPTLARALAAVRPGDTLLIRYNGRLDVDPHEFTREDTRLTIKPDANYRPVLVPAPSVLKRATGLFKLFGGRLVLDGLHFRLPGDRAPAVVVLPGGGQLEMKNVVITMEEGEDLAAVKLTDPRGEMMMGTGNAMVWPVPKVTMENVFVRGKGRLVAIKGSRPFELDVKNAIAVLDSTLIDIEPSTADPSTAGSGLIHLSRVTAYLGGSLLNFRAAERKADTSPTGLARTEVTVDSSLFASASPGEPFIRADRIESREHAERWFSWRARNSIYGNDRKRVMMEIRPQDVEANAIKTVDGNAWLEMTVEESDPFATVNFADKLPEAGQTRKFLGVRPAELRPNRFEPARPENAGDVGAPIDVPAPYPEE